MGGRSGIGKVIFTLVVLMLLVRPFFVYHITAAKAQRNSEVAWRMLQRLIKKKDEHAGHQVGEVAAFEQTGLRLRLALKTLLNKNRLKYLFPLNRPVSLTIQTNPFIPFQRYRYRLTSCLLI